MHKLINGIRVPVERPQEQQELKAISQPAAQRPPGASPRSLLARLWASR